MRNKAWFAIFSFTALVGHPAAGIADPAPAPLRQARYPREIARISVSLAASEADRTPRMPVNVMGQLRAGRQLSSSLSAGLVVRWSLSQAQLASSSTFGAQDMRWYRGLAIAPALSYDGHRFCVTGFAGMGLFGDRWNAAAVRILPSVIACAAATPRALFILGAGAVWRPESGRLLFYPIVGFKLKGVQWDADVLFPFHARATYWPSTKFGIGVQATSGILPYSTSLPQAPQVTLLAPTAGVRLAFAARQGTDFGVTVGAGLDTSVKGASGFAGPIWVPVLLFDVGADESLVRPN